MTFAQCYNLVYDLNLANSCNTHNSFLCQEVVIEYMGHGKSSITWNAITTRQTDITSCNVSDIESLKFIGAKTYSIGMNEFKGIM